MNDHQIARQVDVTIGTGQPPCMEVAPAEATFVSHDGAVRFCGSAAGYYHNRILPIWEHPKSGCTVARQMLEENLGCSRAYPKCDMRLAASGSIKHIQVGSFIVHMSGAPPTAGGPSSRYRWSLLFCTSLEVLLWLRSMVKRT